MAVKVTVAMPRALVAAVLVVPLKRKDIVWVATFRLAEGNPTGRSLRVAVAIKSLSATTVVAAVERKVGRMAAVTVAEEALLAE